jgi:hypothetical protein
MGAYVSQSRNSSIHAGPIWYGPDGHDYSLTYDIPSNKQSTTSYRSGARFDQEHPALTDGQIWTNATMGSFLNPYDTGHDFDTSNMHTIVEPTKLSMHGVGESFLSFKPYLVNNVDYPVLGNSWYDLPDVNLDALGAEFINRSIPTKPVLSISELIAQLATHQEIPGVKGVLGSFAQAKDLNYLLDASSLKQTIKNFLEKSGDSYLDLEFGWAPFVNDISLMLNAVSIEYSRLRQFYRDSGRNVYRTRSAPVISSVSEIVAPRDLGSRDMPLLWFGGQGGDYRTDPWFGQMRGQYSVYDTYVQESWFAGMYSYTIPNAKTFLDKWAGVFDQVQFALGLGLTPTVLWDLTPWSWLVDWFTDSGTIVNNGDLFSQNGLVMKYGYVMCRQVKTRAIVLGNATLNGKPIGTFVTSAVSERKQRHKATPFGFGVNMDALSAYQLGILGSLASKGIQSPKLR